MPAATRLTEARTALLSVLLAGLPVMAPAQSAFSGPYLLLDEDVARYRSAPPNDVIARLQRRLDRGEAKLNYQEPHGYLLSVLRELGIPVSSQALVFSKTSFQQHLISAATPRALYFNDSTYLGWVQGGEVIELAAIDPSQGPFYYTLDQHPQGPPKFVRREECLQCHASPKTLGLPGFLLRSVLPAADGWPHFQAPSFVTDHSSPFKQRWGGWYVTGTHGSQRHMGNISVKDNERPDQLDPDSGANVTSLKGLFDVAPYATAHSDLVALMLLAHQTQLHNLMNRVNWETRIAVDRQESENKARGLPAGTWSEPRRQRVHDAVDELLRYMLFADETRLQAPLSGTTGFAKEFAAAGPRDSAGRSLRDLDLNRRIFRYPCSFLIYSEAFDALPKPALDYFYRRLFDVLTAKDLTGKNPTGKNLTGKNKDETFSALSRPDREAILSILRQTKHSLPAYWRASAH